MNPKIPKAETAPLQDDDNPVVPSVSCENTMRSSSRRLMKMVAVCTLVWLISTSYLLWQERSTTFFRDESGWIRTSMLSAELFLNGNFSGNSWEIDTNFGELNPPVGKLLMGLPVLLYARMEGIAPYRGFFIHGKNFEQNLELGGVPPRELLLPARVVSIALGALICVVVFMITHSLGGGIAAFLAVVLLLFNKTFVFAATHAMMDMPYNLFLLLGVLALQLFFDSPSSRSRLGAAALGGLAGGLASSVKFIGLPLIGLFFTLVIMMCWKTGRDSLRVSFMHLSSVALVGIVTVYVLTPNYWPRFNHFEALALVTELRQVGLEGKKIPMADGTEKGFLDLLSEPVFQRKELREEFPQIGNVLLPPVEFFLLPLRWGRLYDEINTEQKKVPPGTFQILGGSFMRYRSFGLESVLLVGSLIYCAYLIWSAMRAGLQRRESVIFVCFLGYTLFLVMTLKIDWDRYYLPSIVSAAVICGVGFSAILQFLKPVLISYTHKECEDTEGNPPSRGHTP